VILICKRYMLLLKVGLYVENLCHRSSGPIKSK